MHRLMNPLKSKHFRRIGNFATKCSILHIKEEGKEIRCKNITDTLVMYTHGNTKHIYDSTA